MKKFNDAILKQLYEFNEQLIELEKNKPKTIQEEIEQLENVEAILAIEKILKLERDFPGIVQVRMLDHLEVLADSARIGKYPLNNWLEPNGRKCDRKTNYTSIIGHMQEAYRGNIDKDSGRFAGLHAACRLMMDHTRREKGIVHELDRTPESKL